MSFFTHCKLVIKRFSYSLLFLNNTNIVQEVIENGEQNFFQS